MKIYCTACCKEKRANKELIESNKRYISDRIKAIYDKSKKDRVEFRILSGKFGLLNPKEKIPCYNHELTIEEIPKLSKIIKKQLSSQKINKVIFFARNPIKNLDWKPYLALIQESCSPNTSLEIKYLKERRDEIEKQRIAKIKKAYQNPKLIERLSKISKEFYKNPEKRKEMSVILKKRYSEHPELRKQMSEILIKRYAMHPELREKISKSMKQVFLEHPNIKKNLMKHFFNWLKKNPESFMNSKGNPNPNDTKTLRQDYVKSTYEAKVADCLFVNKIKYEYETRPLTFNKEKRFALPDFYLPKYKTYIEVLGGYPGSQTKARWKRKIYKKYKVRCIFLTPALILRLDKNLLNKLKP